MKSIEKEVCEPAIPYAIDSGIKNAHVQAKVNTISTKRRDCMTVDEYINLIKEELDKRYENLSCNRQ